MSENRATFRRSGRQSSHRTRTQTTTGHDVYVRARDLPRLLPLWPKELETPSEADHARLLARLRRALRTERQRGLAGHWAYDVARHAQLLRAYRTEATAYMSRSGKLPAHRLGEECG